jgi:hypothetical protein
LHLPCFHETLANFLNGDGFTASLRFSRGFNLQDQAKCAQKVATWIATVPSADPEVQGSSLV